jgi:hypothetical protein
MNYLIALATTLLVAFGSNAYTEETGKPGRVITGMIKSEVIVEKINYQTREISVIDATGRRFSVVADDAVTNIEQIQPRDRIVTEYMESVAIFVTPEGAPELPNTAMGAVNPEGTEPGVAGLESNMLKASIKSIDRSSRRVVLQDENGNTSSFKVAAETPLEQVDVGDEVRVRLTRAVAITVEHPEN